MISRHVIDRHLYRLVVLNGMRASDELSEDQTRQLLFDLESAHAAFYRYLSE